MRCIFCESQIRKRAIHGKVREACNTLTVAQGIESQGLFIVEALAYVKHAYNITVHHPSEIHNPTPLALAARVHESYADLTTWHWQLGHANHNAICYLAKSGLVKGMRL